MACDGSGTDCGHCQLDVCLKIVALVVRMLWVGGMILLSLKAVDALKKEIFDESYSTVSVNTLMCVRSTRSGSVNGYRS